MQQQGRCSVQVRLTVGMLGCMALACAPGLSSFDGLAANAGGGQLQVTPFSRSSVCPTMGTVEAAANEVALAVEFSGGFQWVGKAAGCSVPRLTAPLEGVEASGVDGGLHVRLSDGERTLTLDDEGFFRSLHFEAHGFDRKWNRRVFTYRDDDVELREVSWSLSPVPLDGRRFVSSGSGAEPAAFGDGGVLVTLPTDMTGTYSLELFGLARSKRTRCEGVTSCNSDHDVFATFELQSPP